jgi:parvulin-like peptidyl-prolyl isomerase
VIINGEAVSWDALRPAMVEAAGAVALEEAALDIALRDALGARGVRMADLDLDAERAILIEQLATAAPARMLAANESRADRGERLLAQLRAARGLGAERFEGFLRRNAALRLLVRDAVVLNESVVRQSYELQYGERIPARILVVDTIADATRALERIDAGEPFSEVAALVSTDESASRGGLLEPVSPVDPTYPSAIREALARLAPGEHSPPIAIDTGVAILRREASDAADPVDRPALDSVRDSLERDARLRQERILMGEKARELLDGSRITIFDDALDSAWRRRTGAVR